MEFLGCWIAVIAIKTSIFSCFVQNYAFHHHGGQSLHYIVRPPASRDAIGHDPVIPSANVAGTTKEYVGHEIASEIIPLLNVSDPLDKGNAVKLSDAKPVLQYSLSTKSRVSTYSDTLLSGWRTVKGLSEKAFLSSTRWKRDRRETAAIEHAYRRCEYITMLFSKTFHTGCGLLPYHQRRHIWAIYAWCRRTDDIVDSPRALLNKDSLREDLVQWEQRLEDIWAGRPRDVLDLALSHTVRCYPSLDITPFRDMIAGMVMDVPGLGQDRYASFADLHLYCYRVAGTVGLMTLPILGVEGASPADYAKAGEAAVSLGVALQLTNILRDVGEDLERGRVYLPLNELREYDVTEEDLFACRVTPQYRAFLQFQIDRARDYYREAAKGISLLSPSARFAVRASLDLYSQILAVIERNRYDNFRQRAFTTKFEKLALLPRSLYRAWVSPKE